MILEVYALYDMVARAYSLLSPFQTEDIVLRTLRFEVNNNPRLKADAADYQLVHIGKFDADAGTITPESHVVVCRLDSLRERDSNDND